MERLVGGHERIDDGSDPAQLAGTLRDLVRINVILGGAELSWRALEGCIGSDRAGVSLLDVGTGAADIPRHLLRRASQRGVPLTVTASDVRADVVGLARRWSAGCRGLTVEVAAAGTLAYADATFDVAHASLVLHHLEPAQATSLLTEMGRVARNAVIVNDLARARRWWVGAIVLSRLTTRNRYTRHDAPLSVRRAYTPDELADLAAAAGLQRAALLHGPLGHRYALVLRSV